MTVTAFEARIIEIVVATDRLQTAMDGVRRFNRVVNYIFRHWADADVCPVCNGHGIEYEETTGYEGWQRPCIHCYGRKDGDCE